MTRQSTTTTHQDVQTGPEGGIEPLDIGGVEHLSLYLEGLLLLLASLHQASFNFHKPSCFRTLYHLPDHHAGPGQSGGTSHLAGVHSSSEDALPGFDITYEAIGDQQEGCVSGTGAYLFG